MNMINSSKIKLLVLFLVGYVQLNAQQDMRLLIDNNLKKSVSQYKYLSANVPFNQMPKTFANNKWILSDRTWWCSGFYSGTLAYLYEATGEEWIKQELKIRLDSLESEKYNSGDHDLGFKMYCSFGNAYRLTKDVKYKNVILTSANTLATRYRPQIKAIQSWPASNKFKCPVIIDNMMNLELLLWSAKNGGNDSLATIALNHANTTITNQFKKDNSCYHVVDYNLGTGKAERKMTAQGASDSSSWSRGQGWALYGYTMMYRFTKNPVYLKQAQKIAKFILQNKNLPQDKIPYWDFDAPGIPNALRDVSAATVYASALLELGQYVGKTDRTIYVKNAALILKSLSTSQYMAEGKSNGGFLLKHSVGSIPHNVEIDVPLTYADYYFVEAMLRYKKWYLN